MYINMNKPGIPINKLRETIMRCGGKVRKIKRHTLGGRIFEDGGNVNTDIPDENGQAMNQDATLVTNNQGGLQGSHDTGQNIPMERNGQQVGVAEPGEVIMKLPNGEEYVLSKKLGFAQKYIQMEQAKKQLEMALTDKSLSFDKKNTLRREIEKIKLQENQLPAMQEQMKQEMGINNDTQSSQSTQDMSQVPQGEQQMADGGWLEAGLSTIPSLVGLAYNVHSINKTPKFEKPELMNPLSLRRTNINNELYNIDNSIASQNNMIDYNSSNSNDAMARKQFALNRGNEFKGQAFARKNAMDTEIGNKETLINSDITVNNKALLNAWRDKNTQVEGGKNVDRAKAVNILADRLNYINEYRDKQIYQKDLLDIQREGLKLNTNSGMDYNWLWKTMGNSADVKKLFKTKADFLRFYNSAEGKSLHNDIIQQALSENW